MRLNELQAGQTATISSIRHSGSMLQRLMEMGMAEGQSVTVVRRAPMGDPIEVRLGDFSLSLRLADAALIDVKP